MAKWLVSFRKRLASTSRVLVNSNPTAMQCARGSLERSRSYSITSSAVARSVFPWPSNPALQLAQYKLADHIHARFAVVKAGDRGELLAAIMLEDLGIFLRDLFQRLQAIGGEAGRDHGNAAHTIFGEL